MLMHFKIDFPDRVIACMGKIVRIGGMREGLYHDVAAHLEGISSEDQHYIESYVRQNLP